jgi:hypothetical protein
LTFKAEREQEKERLEQEKHDAEELKRLSVAARFSNMQNRREEGIAAPTGATMAAPKQSLG